MTALVLHEFHEALGARFGEVGGEEVVAAYGDGAAEYRALRDTAGVLDLSCRGRLVLLGADRQKLLNGQVTHNVRDLRPGQGCYAFLVNAKARILADLNAYALDDELLLDLEPGTAAGFSAHLDRFIVADDVRIVDAAPHYGLLSVQGPRAGEVVADLGLFPEPPPEPQHVATARDGTLGDLYLANQARTGTRGFDLFVPTGSLAAVADRLIAAARARGGAAGGWEALEVVRVEAGIPRFGADMDATNLAPEPGLGDRAISTTKGCYSGQEVIARIRTYGQVTRALRGLELTLPSGALPPRGTRLFRDGKEVGQVTTSVRSPDRAAAIALGYVRRECNQPGTELRVGSAEGDAKAVIVPLPFLDSPAGSVPRIGSGAAG
jgi:folate-binding protein YgfZ